MIIIDTFCNIITSVIIQGFVVDGSTFHSLYTQFIFSFQLSKTITEKKYTIKSH